MAGQGAQVGSAHVSIFPVMSGFKSAVSKGVREAGDSSSSAFSASFNGAGRKTGKKLGDDLRGAFSTATSKLSESVLRPLETSVGKAQASLSKARMKQADDAGKVRVAEARLAEAVKRSGEGSAAAIAAAERLASARRRAEASDAAAAGAADTLAAAERDLACVQAELAASSDEVSDSISNVARRFAEGFRSAKVGQSAFSGIEGSLGSLARSLAGVDIWGPAASKVAAGARGLASSAASAISAGLGRAREGARSAASGVATAIGSGLSRAQRAASSAMERVAEALPTPVRRVASAFGTYLSPIVTATSSVFSKLPSAASSGLNSLVNGVRNGANLAREALSQIGSAVSTAMFAGAAAGVAALTGKIISLTPEVVSASDATDKFKSTLNFAGLDSSKIDELTKSTQEYADRTVYELSDIQGVTAQLAANSVKDYDKLAEAAGNLNAVAGGNADTFKSVGMVLTQTAGAGKLTTENWNQLSDAIPGASGKLQEAMKANGAYTGNFREALEKGQITAEEFNQAIMDLGMTDAAKEAATSVSTFEGAFGNLRAAFVGGLSGIVEPLKPLITGAIASVAEWVTPVFDRLSGYAEQLAGFIEGSVQRFGDIGGVLSGFSGLIGPIGAVAAVVGAKGLGGALSSAIGAIGPLERILGPLIAQGGALSKVFGAMTGPVGLAVAAFVGLAATSPEVRSALGGLAQAVLEPLGQIIQALIPPLQQMASAVLPVITQLVQAATPVIAEVVTLVGTFVGSILTALVPAFTAVATAIQQLVAIAMPLIQQFASVFVALMPQVSALIQQLSPVLSALGALIGSVVTQAVSFLTGVLVPAFQALSPAVSSAVEMVGGVLNAAVQVISGVVSVISGIISGDWGQVWEGFKSIVSGAIDGLGSLLGGVKDIVMGAFSGIGSWLLDSGGALIQGFVDGFTGALDWAGEQISNGLEFLRGLFPFSPAKRGPFSGHGYTTYSGRALMTDFARAIESRRDAVAAAVRSALSAAQDEMALYGSMGGPGAHSGAAGGSGVSQTFVFNQPVQSPDEFARVMRMQQRYGIAAVS